MANNTLAYGFTGLADIMGQRVGNTDNGTRQLQTAILDTAAEHNRQMEALLASLVMPTEKYTERYELPGTGTLQPLDEWGNPLPVKAAGYYDVAYPIQSGGTAWGDNRVSRALLTFEEANRRTVNCLEQDRDWMRRHIMAALFDDGTWSYTDPRNGTLTIQPLANGDTVTYPKRGGTSATDNHYLAQAATIADNANPYPTIYDELAEHPGNQGSDIVAYIASDLVATTSNLATFRDRPDANVQLADTVTRLSRTIDPGFGDQVLGYVSRVWVVEWGSLPSGYIFAQARGADEVLAMRQYPDNSLQGLQPSGFSPDGNRQEYRFIRDAGFGVRNRVGGVAMLIGSGSYSTPSGLSTPLQV